MDNVNKYIGKKLEGRYEIIELIGIGGMADVYKAFDVLEEREVAVKVLKEEYLSNEDFKRRFRNESKAISVLSHQNIVKIFDVSFGEKIQFIVMEYVDGITLKEYIEQQTIVPWKEAIHFTLQILRALQHAHDNGIVHRDIKPQNVMILRDGSVKVMDFGIARFARDNGRTISEKAIGSVHYISPEQARGEITDEKTDIYSVGVMMFEMLTGKLPFDGDSPVSVALKQMQEEPARPRDINPELSEGLEEIIVRAMKKDTDLRYQTAAEMLRDIDEFKRNPSVVFEYKYFIDNDTTKYFDKVKEEPAKPAAKKGKSPKKAKKKRMSPTMQILLGVSVVAIAIIAITLSLFFKSVNTPTEEILAYDLIGLNYEDVINDEDYKSLQIVKVGEEKSDEYEAGIIIEQDPKANKTTKVGAVISVIVSSGLNQTIVPDVSGETQESARETLEKAGFTVTDESFVTKFSNTVSQGIVINTNPAADSEAKKSDEIKIYVSSGVSISTVRVPSLLGMTESLAKQKLLSSGLKYGTIQEVNSSEPKGTVVNQSLSAGSSVNKGTSVELQVSSGVASKVELEVKIPLPSNGKNAKVDFVIFLDGTQTSIVSVNPKNTTSLDFKVAESGIRTLTIQVAKQNYARYEVDFDEGTIKQIGTTNNDLIIEKEVSSTTSPDTSSNSSSDTSSNTSSDTTTDDSDDDDDDEDISVGDILGGMFSPNE